MNRYVTLAFLASTAITVATASYAEDSFKDAVPLNIPHAFASSTPPPEPSPTDHPHLHTTWQKAQGMRQIIPHLERHEGVFHGPHMAASGSAKGSAGFANSINWSGSATYGTANGQFGTSTMAMTVLVPKHEQSLGKCGGDGTTYTATWIGVDGWGTDTVEQSGLWIGVNNCSPPIMSAFIEVYPNPEISVTNFPVAAGDTITIFNWVNQAARTECAQWVNESQNVATSTTCLIAPGPFLARSIEWVVERPTYGNQFVNLANYTSWPIWNAWAWDSNNGHILAASSENPYDFGASGQFYWVAMMDNNWNMISYPNGMMPSTMIMYDTGSAYCAQGASCVPRY